MNEPRVTADELIARLSPVLSPWRRFGGLAALLGGLSGAGLLASLWATEPGPLPDRTHLAFALLTLLCLAWTGYGAWVLTRRTPLFALDRVVAGWLALAASTLTTVVMAVVAVLRDTLPFPALGAGAAFVAVAVTLTARAHRRRAALLRRKRELEQR